MNPKQQNDTMVKYSIVIPVFNCGLILKNCIESIIASKISGLEILLIDDGSEPDTASLCDKLSDLFEQVRTIHQKNQGVSAARNRGMNEARGKWLLFADGDDTINSEALQALLYQFEKEPEADIAVFGMSFDYYYHGTCYRQEKKVFPWEGLMLPEEWKNYWADLERANYWTPIWNKVFRLDLLRNYQILFPEDQFLYEDFVFSIRTLAWCEKIYVSGEPIYHYRQAEDEKKAAYRLMKIPHIDIWIDQIGNELQSFVDQQKMRLHTDEFLFDLYQMLSRMKISIASRSQIRIICMDFRKWIDKKKMHYMIQHGSYTDALANQKINRLIYLRIKTKIRHGLAVRLKAARIIPPQ